MVENNDKIQQILIACKCGGTFTLNSDKFIKKHEETGASLKCLNCSEAIDPKIRAPLKNFCEAHSKMVTALKGTEYKMALINPQEIGLSAIHFLQSIALNP